MKVYEKRKAVSSPVKFSDIGQYSLKRSSTLIDTVKSRYLEVDGTIFYKFKLPEVQTNLHFGNLDL